MCKKVLKIDQPWGRRVLKFDSPCGAEGCGGAPGHTFGVRVHRVQKVQKVQKVQRVQRGRLTGLRPEGYGRLTAAGCVR